MDAKTERMIDRDLKRLSETIAERERYGRKSAAKGRFRTARTYGHDVADLRAVAAAVKAGDYEYAKEVIRDLETVVRDDVPTALYNWLFRIG